MSDEEDLKKFSANFQQNWQRIQPDYVIDYGEEGKVIIEIKAVSKDGSVGSGKIEQRALEILEALGLGNAKYTACKFHYVPELSRFEDEKREKQGVFIKYDGSNEAICFTGFEGIVCKKCFENPSMSVDGFELFDEFKKYKNKQESEIFRDEYSQQVRSAVNRINNRFKKEFKLDVEVLTYSSVPIVFINKEFFY